MICLMTTLVQYMLPRLTRAGNADTTYLMNKTLQQPQVIKERLTNLQKFAPLVHSVAHHWDAAIRPIWWDRLNDVFTTDKRSAAYSAVFGRRMYRTARSLKNWSIKYGLGNGRRWFGPFNVDLPLPASAMIIRPYQTRGPIVVGPEEGRVLKIIDPRWGHTNKWEREKLALKTAERANLKQFIPRLISEGVSGPYSWIVSDLKKNETPFVQSFGLISHYMWSRFFLTEVMPVMYKLYTTVGIDEVSGSDVVAEAEDLVSRYSGASILRPLLDKVKRIDWADTVIHESLIHGDICPPHIHRTSNNWSIIDWGEARRDAIVVELLREYWNSPTTEMPFKQQYWEWLRGEVTLDRVSPRLRMDINACLSFESQYMGVSGNSDMLRSRIYVTYLRELMIIFREYRSLFDDSDLRALDADLGGLPWPVKVGVHKIRALV